MMLKAKFWLEMISATAMKKDQTKTKSAGRAHMVKILWTPVTPFWYRLNGADMKIFLVKKPRSNEAQSNDFNETNWSLNYLYIFDFYISADVLCEKELQVKWLYNFFFIDTMF